MTDELHQPKGYIETEDIYGPPKMRPIRRTIYRLLAEIAGGFGWQTGHEYFWLLYERAGLSNVKGDG